MAQLVEFTDENNAPREVGIGDPMPVTTSFSGRLVTKTITFTGAAHLGLSGSAIPLFSVTGNCFIKVFGVCSVDLTSSGGTLETGIVGNTAALIAQTTASTIDAGELWYDNTPVVGTTAVTNITERLISDADIIGTVGSADITAGTLKWYLYFLPLEKDATISAA
jgi:hypothetical protein